MMRRSALYSTVLALALSAPSATLLADDAPTTGPATNPAAETDRQKQIERDRVEKEEASLRIVRCQSMDDIFALHVSGDDLILNSPMPLGSDPVRVQLDGLPGFNTVRVWGQGDPVTNLPQFFDFSSWTFNEPGWINVHTEIMVNPINIQIARDAESISETRSILLLLKNRVTKDSGEEPNVRFTVRGQSSFSDRATADVSLTADNLRELRRQHPHEVGQYLEPILRDLHQELNVFQIDSNVAWQAFSDSWQPDARLLDQVNAAVAAFNADSFPERANAMTTLKQIGVPAALVLLRMDRKGFTPEQTSQVEAFLAPFQPMRPDQRARLANDPQFLLDCLYSSDARIRAIAAEHLEHHLGHKIAFDPDAPAATRLAQADQLRDQFNPPITQPTSEPATQPAPADPK